MNNYKKAEKKVIESSYSIKSLKTLEGREGLIINANLYFKNKKIASVLDSGNGGCLDIDYEKVLGHDHYRTAPKHLLDFLESLPSYTMKEMGIDSFREDEPNQMNDEDFCNILIYHKLDQQDFNKLLKKVSVITADDKVESYKAKASDLNKMFDFKEGLMTFRDYVLNEKSVKLILNDVALKDGISEAFDIYLQHR